MNHDVSSHALEIEERVVRWRREFHKNPEPGFGEFQTATVISAQLQSLGYTVRVAEEAMDAGVIFHRPEERIEKSYARALDAGIQPDLLDRMRRGGTAVVADLVNAPGPIVAFRFDMDCLPIAEAADPDHRPTAEGFQSAVGGEMHACGHDGHMAIGLGVGTVLARLRSQLRGTVRLIFQPAEEGVLGGAKAITARGLVDDVDYFIACHLGLGAKTGEFVSRADFLATTKYKVSFTGHAAHVVNAPQAGRNALLAAASAALALHSIPPHGDGWLSLNVGVLRAGDEQGVSPAWATMEMGIWATTSDVHDYVDGRVREILAGTEATWGVSTEVKVIGTAPVGPADDALARMAGIIAARTPGIEKVTDFMTCRAGEDANVFLDRVGGHGGKGIYVIVGSQLSDGHHTPHFDFDERALTLGTTILSSLALELLAGNGQPLG
jgi:aminobenzoyl-glutamate utilization protein A